MSMFRSGSVKLPTKRFGAVATQRAHSSLTSRSSSSCSSGAAHDVPWTTVDELSTWTSMPRSSMSATTASGSIILAVWRPRGLSGGGGSKEWRP